MKNILFILLSLFTLHTTSFAAFDLIVTPSHDDEPAEVVAPKNKLLNNKLLIMISSGELEKAGMGLALGLNAAKKGIKVTYIIGAKALNSAKIAGKQNLFLATQMTPRAILQEAISDGAQVQICSMSAEAAGLSEKDFIKGAKIVKSDAIFDKIYADGVKLLSF